MRERTWRVGVLVTGTLLGGALFCGGCKKDAPASAASGPQAGAVKWDEKGSPVDAPDWPMKSDAIPAAAVASFAKSDGGLAGPAAPTELWTKLRPFSESYLKSWRSQLSGDPSSPVDVVDAFTELSLQVTGPTGFWRKTLPEQWLGCAQNAETPPCQKMAGMQDELSQWDAVQEQLDKLPPEKAQKFVQKNYAKLEAYLETYVPSEPSAAEMKKTPFYQKHLAAVMDGMM